MIKRPYLICCDFCQGTFQTNAKSRQDARNLASNHGWMYQKKPGEWIDICPTCAKE